jgi:hypothetical protein
MYWFAQGDESANLQQSHKEIAITDNGGWTHQSSRRHYAQSDTFRIEQQAPPRRSTLSERNAARRRFDAEKIVAPWMRQEHRSTSPSAAAARPAKLAQASASQSASRDK